MNSSKKISATEAPAPAGDLKTRLTAQRARYGRIPPLSVSSGGQLYCCILSLMFPHFLPEGERDTPVDGMLATARDELARLIAALLPERALEADAITCAFLDQLPTIADACHADAEALREGDPAATSLDEVILSYPGFYAITAYRVAHALLKLGVPLLPRMITEFAHHRTGIDIHPGATIGKSLHIDHGTSVVIGETAIIGNNVKIYQGVTIGALRVDESMRAKKRHPTIEDNVVIYANATILGGDTVVGANSVIGGNVWLTRSVPAWSRVMFRPCDTEEIIPIDTRRKA